MGKSTNSEYRKNEHSYVDRLHKIEDWYYYGGGTEDTTVTCIVLVSHLV
jgi:hypothetical protein